MTRRIITAAAIDDLAAQGDSCLVVGPQVQLTDLARERARDRGIRLVNAADAGADESAPASSQLAAQVRAGVIAALGQEPAGLDQVIARVLGRSTT